MGRYITKEREPRVSVPFAGESVTHSDFVSPETRKVDRVRFANSAKKYSGPTQGI